MAALVAVGLRLFVLEPFVVPSAAMAPTLQPGDRILVVKAGFLAGAVGRGEIVVIRHPDSSSCATVGASVPDLVTRVIGLPGETIWSVSGTVYIDGRPLKETGWYDRSSGPLGSAAIGRTTIPRDGYFVMSDNRADTCDSRSFGTVSGSAIVGRVVAIVARHGHPTLHFV